MKSLIGGVIALEQGRWKSCRRIMIIPVHHSHTASRGGVLMAAKKAARWSSSKGIAHISQGDYFSFISIFTIHSLQSGELPSQWKKAWIKREPWLILQTSDQCPWHRKNVHGFSAKYSTVAQLLLLTARDILRQRDLGKQIDIALLLCTVKCIRIVYVCWQTNGVCVR